MPRWLRSWLWPWLSLWRCPHANLRCTHGDEIVERGFRRAVCLDCGRALDMALAICSVTGEPHPGGLGAPNPNESTS